MNFELKQHFRLESARFLPNLAEGHPCRRVHGHSFRVTLRLVGPLQPELDWLRDYHQISELMRPLIQELDHHLLNEIPGLENPTSEVLCRWIYEKAQSILPELKQVSISETEDTECSYPVL